LSFPNSSKFKGNGFGSNVFSQSRNGCLYKSIISATNKTPKEEYLKKASSLTKEQAEFLIMRMDVKLGRRLDDHKLIPLEALAMQLEIEDEHRKELHENFAEIKSRFNQLQNQL